VWRIKISSISKDFKMTNLTKFILAAFVFPFAANINAQTQTAIIGESSQLKFNISNVTNTNKCHIEVTLPNQQKVGVEVDGPQFLASVEFTPQQIGNNVIQWEGKNKLRGLKSVFACPGSGVIQVQVNGNTDQIAQKWNQYFSTVNEEIRDCVKVGMDLSQLKYQVLADPTVTLTSPQDPKLKPIYEKCESFAKQIQPRKGAPCTLASQNNLKTICDGVYAERQPDGRLKTISRTAAIQLQFEGKPWTVGVLENLDVRAARLKQEEEDKSKQAAEIAAKKEADEKERLFKLTPEYKKQQAALEIKRIADEKEAARKQAEQEKIKIAEAREAAAKAKKDQEEQEREAKKKAINEKSLADARRAQAEKERLEYAKEFPFYAVVTCGGGGSFHAAICFSGRTETELELRNGSFYKMYTSMDIWQMRQSAAGLSFDLRNKFELKMQNSDDSLILNLKVYNRATNQIVFEKSAARFGVIRVSN
jgi:hypothetical protein